MFQSLYKYSRDCGMYCLFIKTHIFLMEQARLLLNCGKISPLASFVIQIFPSQLLLVSFCKERWERHLNQLHDTTDVCYNYKKIFPDAAAAEVFVHGCCSSLNRTSHHLTSSAPPPLVTTSIYRAEIMSQTIQNGDIKTRYV